MSIIAVSAWDFQPPVFKLSLATKLVSVSEIDNPGNPDKLLSYIFDNVSTSIVQVVSITPPLFNLNPQAQNATEVGAGFIFDDAVHIVTANHVLAGANNVSVVFKDGDRYDVLW